MKTNKSFQKRIKLTKTGKMKIRAKGRCHFNAKERNPQKMAKKKMGNLKLSKKIKSLVLPKK